MQPGVAEFVFHQGEVDQRVLGLGDAACGFVADLEAGAVLVVADGADHGEGDGEGGVDAFLAGRGLDEIGPGHHADEAGAGDVAQGAKFAGGEDGLDVGLAAGFAHVAHFVVERLPVLGQDVAAGDDDVDLPRAGADAFADLG